MKVFQQEMRLRPKSRGFHLITAEILENFKGLRGIKTGSLKVFLKHTSAGLTLNENADPTVRDDFESHFNYMVPENQSYYKHTLEGPDDMPAHIKTALVGNTIEIPITNGKLNLGTWQGIYLCEFRHHGGSRKAVVTAMGV